MVTSTHRFLIDTTFIFENTHKAFLGAPLLIKEGRDYTFLFGFTRDFLRIRHSFGINDGVIVIGKEAFSVTTKEKVHNVLNVIKEMGAPYVYDSNNSILDINSHLSQQASYVITQDKKLLQLANDTVSVILPNNLKDIDYMTPGVIKSKIGVDPKDIPTFLSLTEGAKSSKLTKLQAIRLIELYTDIDGIYENICEITSTIKKKLAINEEAFRSAYSKMRIKEINTSLSYNISDYTMNLNNEKNISLLQSHGFYSLTRLLKSQSKVHLTLNADKKESSSYHAIVDSKGIRVLEKLLLSSEYCAIDTEADDKDPHHATLFGVSFSVKNGEAFFVPLIEFDLKGISRKDVVLFLKRIFKKPIKFIGQNIKYDYLLLRKNGIKIDNIHFDTMLAAYDCYGDWIFFNLKYLSKRLLGKTIKSYQEIVRNDETFLDLPFKVIVKHACEDADVTLRLYHILMKELERKGITEQYFNKTITQVKKLGDFEYDGISVNTDTLKKIRGLLMDEAVKAKQNIWCKIGKSIDLDSQKELRVVLNDTLNLRELVGSKTIGLSALEQLAINRPIVKLIVEYKRKRKQLIAIDSIVKAIKEGKIYPIFNQMKSTYGQLTSNIPNLFDIDGISNLKGCCRLPN